MTNTSIVGKSQEADAAKELQRKSGELQKQLNNLFQEQIDSHENRIVNLEDNMRINGIQEMNIKDAGNVAVIKALGGKDSNAYQDRRVRSMTYSAMWRRFKQKFGIPRYGELPAKDFDNAINHLETWVPDKDLELKIKVVNKQQVLELQE